MTHQKKYSRHKFYRYICVTTLLLFMLGCTQEDNHIYQGYVEGDFAYIASSQSGELTHLYVQKGQSIKAGSQLFLLESQNETEGVKQATYQLRSLQFQEADSLTGKRPSEIKVIVSQLEQARATLALAIEQQKRDEIEYRGGGISNAQLDKSNTSLETAKWQVKELEAQLQVANLPAREKQIKSQQAQVNAARTSLAQAKWKLNQKQTQSASDGLVFDTFYQPGEWVPAGSPVVKLLSPDHIKVRFFVPQDNLSSVSLGRKVNLHCVGCSPTDIPAEITYISDQAEYTPLNIYSNDTNKKFVFMIEAKPTIENASKLHPGQPVEVILQ